MTLGCGQAGAVISVVILVVSAAGLGLTPATAQSVQDTDSGVIDDPSTDAFQSGVAQQSLFPHNDSGPERVIPANTSETNDTTNGESPTQSSATDDGDVSTLAETVSITGRVAFADGTDASGWTITNYYSVDTRTEMNGSFDLRVDANESHNIVFRQTDGADGKANFPKDGRPDLHAITEVAVGDSNYSIGTVTLPEGHLVNVTVENESGAKLSNIDVFIRVSNEDASLRHYGRTNATGELVLDGATNPGVEVNGSLYMRINGEGPYADRSIDVQIENRRNLTIVLRKTVEVSGRLVDESGEPMVMDSVGFAGKDANGSLVAFELAETDSDGEFSITAPRNLTYNVVLSQRNKTDKSWFPRDGVTDHYEVALIDVANENVSTGNLTVPDAAGILEIQVVSETGTPVEDAVVDLIPNHQNGHDAWFWREYTNTSGYPQHDHDAAGYEATGNYTVRVKPPYDSQRFVDTEYVRNVSVSGDTSITVTLEKPAPVANFTHRPTDPDGDGAFEDVNGDGTFDLSDVQALFTNTDEMAGREHSSAFDVNGDDTVDVLDVQALYAEYQNQQAA